MVTCHLPFILFLLTSVTAAYISKKLTLPASLTGGILAAIIYLGVGWPGIFLLGTFFLLGTASTSWKKRNKVQKNFASEADSKRTTGQVLANGGMAGILGILSLILPEQGGLILLLIAAVFSSATADTVSSELGSIYGSRFYDILSFQRRTPGADGIVSVEGTLFGIIGSIVVAVVYGVTGQFNSTFFWIVIAGILGNLTDSFLGATLERKGVLRNNAVNFLNTLVAVVFAYLLASF